MKYLLDTHVFLWLHLDPGRIPRAARDRLTVAEATLVVSAVSGWEMASKQASGVLLLPGPASIWLPVAIEELKCELLSLNLDHAVQAALLPLHHRDPFDRFLVAQARIENLVLVTADRVLAAYDVEILRA